MLQRFDRLPQLRVLVNSDCGRACFFCRPGGEAVGETLQQASLDPGFVCDLAEMFLSFGGSFVKLTGGDPALWDALVPCVAKLKQQIGVPQVHVISRHPRIGELAADLAAAGVDLLNISLDTLDASLHARITGKDDLPDVLDAVRKCVLAGVPVKINTVVMAGINDCEVPHIIEFCERAGVTSVKLMDMIVDLHDSNDTYATRLQDLTDGSLRDLYVSLSDAATPLRAKAIRSQVRNQGDLGHPMTVLTMPSGLSVILKDSDAGAWHGTICEDCESFPCHDALMALRVTATGRLQYCLLREEISVDIGQHWPGDLSVMRECISSALDVYNKATFRTDWERECVAE